MATHKSVIVKLHEPEACVCTETTNEMTLFFLVQVILALYQPIVFANYSLGENQVSRTAEVYSDESLLFVVGNKVHFLIPTVRTNVFHKFYNLLTTMTPVPKQVTYEVQKGQHP